MDINTLLNQLGEWAELEDSYSIKTFANEVGIPYKTILALSKENEEFCRFLDMVKERLSCNANNAAFSGRISCDEGIKYFYENDYEFIERLRENEGVVIPEDEEEFEAWFEQRIVKDREVYE